jgi:hypothetical protein
LYLSQKAQEHLRRQQTDFQKTGQNLQVQDLQAIKKAANTLLDTTSFSSLGKNQALTAAANALGSTLRAGSLAGAQNAARQIRSEVDHSSEEKSTSRDEHSSSLPSSGTSASPIQTVQQKSMQNDETANQPTSSDRTSSNGGASSLNVFA